MMIRLNTILLLLLSLCCFCTASGQAISEDDLPLSNGEGLPPLVIQTDSVLDERPEESYDSIVYKPRTSTIHIPIDINIPFIERKLNEEFEGLLFEDNNIEDDSIMAKAWKESDFKISYVDQTLYYSIPIKFWIKKRFDLGLTSSDREIEGAIKINLKTVISLSKNWDLLPQTSIESYTWIRKPTMKVAFMNVPITYFVNKTLDENKSLIQTTIDNSLKENVPLRTYVQNIWETVQDPIDISTEGYKAWLKSTPQQLYCTPIKGYQGIINTTIGVKCLMEVFLGKIPLVLRKETELPKLSIYTQTDENYNLNIMADVPYYVIDSVAKKTMIGQMFGQGRNSIVVDSIEVYGQNKKLIIGLDIVGFVNGKIYLECVPYYNADDYTIRVKDVDYKMKTKNLIARTVNLFYKKGMKKKIEENLIISLKDEFYLVKELSRSELFNMQIIDNVKLDGMINELNVENIFITQNGLRISLQITGKLRMKIE